MSDLAGLAEAVTVDPLVGHPADYHVFHKFIERCQSLPAITTAVIWPLSDVAMCRAGNALAMMKGSLHTDVLMKVAMQRDTGLRTSRRVTHVFIMDTPAYARTLLIT